eukprot:COSAG02_NODE_1733_length_11168_cov_29.568705_8_plen_55_part_00
MFLYCVSCANSFVLSHLLVPYCVKDSTGMMVSLATTPLLEILYLTWFPLRPTLV